jgi:hypothetical protein
MELNGSMSGNSADDVVIRASAARKRAIKRLSRFTRALPDMMLQLIASGAAAIIPVSVYLISHTELSGLNRENAMRHLPTIALVIAGLAYSAPTVADWARTWTGQASKAWAFTVLIEGTMTIAHVPILPLVCLGWLAGINLLVAFVKSGRRKFKLIK